MLQLIKSDSWLEPFSDIIERRNSIISQKEIELSRGSGSTLSDFASGYLYFGLHRNSDGWIFREWAPNATAIYLIGSFNSWRKSDEYSLLKMDHGVWEITLPLETINHDDYYKLIVEWDGGSGERIPAWARYVVQDMDTHIFSGKVWEPDTKFTFKHNHKPSADKPLLIYECHIGMSSEKEDVSTYNEFTENVLPRIKAHGYNTIQIMGIQEHPYYGSFGYHVSSFFAPSSRFGTPDDLKRLIDTAHSMNITVIMDLVHSHAVKNEVEGLGRFDGSENQYFYEGERGYHKQWDSFCFDYGKNEVLHFLLSNCKYWLEEFNFDGFRFDGVTSMIYLNHGIGEAFTTYADYYDGAQDENALVYLGLANRLIHKVKPEATTIAEEMSGMPGLALPIEDGGYGFNYRMAMNIPDYWIKIIKEKKDEDWSPGDIFWQLTNRRKEEKTISYAESHDQAMVGDKTIIFRLIDSDMYWFMSNLKESSITVDRGLALHKMIRLVTLATINGGYLNFMGNEFGHPEWIDFPRKENGWSHKFARRQWSLADDKNLKYHSLDDFDKAMIDLVSHQSNFTDSDIVKIWDNENDGILAFMRNDLIFIFNFNPVNSFNDYSMLAPTGKYSMVLNSDDKSFGGFGSIDSTIDHFTQEDALHKTEDKGWLKIYIPARCAFVLKRL